MINTIHNEDAIDRLLSARLEAVRDTSDNDLEEALLQVRSKAGQMPGRKRLFRPWAIAAAAAVAVFVAAGIPLISALRSQEVIYRYANDDSAPMRVSLPDGSEVWLRAGSALEYGETFGSNARSIRFSGEGYFNIAADSHKPFFVECNSFRVKVLGTIFNLRDNGSEAPEIVLAKGSVLMQDAEGRNLLELAPGQKATWIADAGVFRTSPTPEGDILQLQYGVVSLHNLTAEEIVERLEADLGVRIGIGPAPDGKTKHYDFNYQIGASPQSVVDLLRFVCNDREFTIE